MGRARPQQKQEDVSGGDDRGGSGRALDGDDGGGGAFHSIAQPNRDPKSNFELDLANRLEEYLLKICSGEPTSDHDHSINFAEAALLLQGSVQVYSRKVEYLYTLVLQALDFISRKKQDHEENASDTRSDKNVSNSTTNEDEDGNFLGLDDVPEETNINLDEGIIGCSKLESSAKPPANLLVLEGDCLDAGGGDAAELETYLLSTCNFYGDFLLLDPRDAVSIHEIQRPKAFYKEHNTPQRGKESSVKSRRQNGFFSSPTGRSGGANHHRSSTKKKQATIVNEFSPANLHFGANCNNETSVSYVQHDRPDFELNHEDHPCAGDSSDDDSIEGPWEPLNPHETGTLKVKPFKKGITSGKSLVYNAKKPTIACEFPLAKPDQTISSEFAVIPKLRNKNYASVQESQPPPLYETLRQSMIFEEPKTIGDNDYDDKENEFEDNTPDFDANVFEMLRCDYDMDIANHCTEKKGDGTSNFDKEETLSYHDLDPDASLEDLCRSHLDVLLASMAENERQTELATRVSTWKQRIECTLEEQDSHPPFDIHLYGEKVLRKISTTGNRGKMCFTDVVMGVKQHEIARTFSALLQLVNNRTVDLDSRQPKNQSFCYTSETPFYVRILVHEGSDGKSCELLPKKRTKSPSKQGIFSIKSPKKNSKVSPRLEKVIAMRCSPRKKGRRRSPSNIHTDPQLTTW